MSGRSMSEAAKKVTDRKPPASSDAASQRRHKQASEDRDGREDRDVRELRTMKETQSGIALEPVYRPADLVASGAGGAWSYAEALGDPGSFPFTRGPHESMYRGKLWTMRMFSGFGTPEDTNRRFKFL